MCDTQQVEFFEQGHNLTYKSISHAAMVRIGFRRIRMGTRRSIKWITTLALIRDDCFMG